MDHSAGCILFTRSGEGLKPPGSGATSQPASVKRMFIVIPGHEIILRKGFATFVCKTYLVKRPPAGFNNLAGKIPAKKYPLDLSPLLVASARTPPALASLSDHTPTTPGGGRGK